MKLAEGRCCETAQKEWATEITFISSFLHLRYEKIPSGWDVFVHVKR
jgi:hypothetical protein